MQCLTRRGVQKNVRETHCSTGPIRGRRPPVSGEAHLGSLSRRTVSCRLVFSDTPQLGTSLFIPHNRNPLARCDSLCPGLMRGFALAVSPGMSPGDDVDVPPPRRANGMAPGGRQVPLSPEEAESRPGPASVHTTSTRHDQRSQRAPWSLVAALAPYSTAPLLPRRHPRSPGCSSFPATRAHTATLQHREVRNCARQKFEKVERCGPTPRACGMTVIPRLAGRRAALVFCRAVPHEPLVPPMPRRTCQQVPRRAAASRSRQGPAGPPT